MISLRSYTVLAIAFSLMFSHAARADDTYAGRYFGGSGDREYLELLETARRFFDVDAELQSLPMLYDIRWNGLVEGPGWPAWWIQNSYGTTYCSLPFLSEPYLTFLQNAQDLWFDQMGDGKRKGVNDWVAPDGALCDAAAPDWIVYKQGDGRIDIHDWGMEFTAAGVVMQAELLLISRDPAAMAHYLPKLERSADFIESRRDPEKNLFLAGPAANLLAPSYAGWKKPDGTFDKAYLTGLSITYIAALDRLIELEKLTGNVERAAQFERRRDSAKAGLVHMTTPAGYFIKSLDPDGTRHGVYGADKHGYFEAVCNHDAICFRVVDDAQAVRIYDTIASIPGLRPHDFIITNYPSLDDTYHESLDSIWKFGMWVNGGHWSTCEARMVMAYYRLGKFEDARRSMKRLVGFARDYKLDNPFSNFGGTVSWYDRPVYLTIDAFGGPAALIRGLFEYIYKSDRLVLMPHIPAGISQLDQRFPVRFGSKRLYLSTTGSGAVTGVTINGKPWDDFDASSIRLPYDELPETVVVSIGLGGASPRVVEASAPRPLAAVAALPEGAPAELGSLVEKVRRMEGFYGRLKAKRLDQTYEAAHARVVVEWYNATCERIRRIADGGFKRLPEPAFTAANKVFLETGLNLADGLAKAVEGYAESAEADKRLIHAAWMAR